jgi:penicillin-binding protein 1A
MHSREVPPDPAGPFDIGGADPVAEARAPRTRRRWRGLLLAVTLLAGLALVLWTRCGLAGCPDVSRLASYQPGGAPVLLDRTGQPFAVLAPVERSMVRLDSLPAHVPAAFLAVEDRRFYRHRGVDWIRVGGATLANARAGAAVQGSSTITMQLARNVFAERIPATEKTFRRKLLEARVARSIERRFAKHEILELYLNHIYFGGGAWGIEAASRHYFGRSAKDLSLDQSALLAAIPKAPTHYDPRRRRDRARQRRDLVLSLMEEQGAIETAEAARARELPIRTVAARDPRRLGQQPAPWFVQRVREELEERLGARLYRAPLRIHTTLDRAAQQVLEEELERQLVRIEGGAFGRYTGERRSGHATGRGETSYVQGAGVILEAATGDVRAFVGGRDWLHSRYDRASAARRQTGSAFKPFVFAAAFKEGWSSEDWLDDAPYRLAARGARVWEPSNFDGAFLGPVTLREALVLSRNVPTVRLAEAVGVQDVARVARDAGLRGDTPASPVLALGVTESSPLELTAAYTAFANQGQVVAPRLVVRVEDSDGRVLLENRTSLRRVFDARVADQVTRLLGEAIDHGTGRAVRSAGYRGPAAGKTGTTNDGADVWFVGYSPTLVAGIWAGFDQPRPIAPRASGGTVAAEVWGRAMRRIGTGDDWPDDRPAARARGCRRHATGTRGPAGPVRPRQIRNGSRCLAGSRMARTHG